MAKCVNRTRLVHSEQLRNQQAQLCKIPYGHRHSATLNNSCAGPLHRCLTACSRMYCTPTDNGCCTDRPDCLLRRATFALWRGNACTTKSTNPVAGSAGNWHCPPRAPIVQQLSKSYGSSRRWGREEVSRLL